MSTFSISYNPEYSLMAKAIMQIRDVVKGSPFIKGKGRIYLPHPSSVDTSSPESIERYNTFIAGAEFDDFTATTKRVMIGNLKFEDMTFEPDAKLNYLIEDVDKDGLSMKGLAESCAGNDLEVKWHLLIADYKGLSELGIREVSAQDVIDANPRATIKQYARETVKDWDFARINGAMQLTYLVLEECSQVVNQETGARETVTSYLKLALDETGYYQQKHSDSTNSIDWGEKSYVSVGGSVLQFIPATIVCDEEIPSGKMPMELGFLSAIGDLALYRYRVSADYKEALSMYKPSMHITGVNDQTWETFVAVNKRDYVGSGPVANIWDEDVEVKLLEASGSMVQYKDYFEDNKNRVTALGGVFKTEATIQRTATEVIAEAQTTTSVLIPLANNIESGLRWQVGYCAMFEGIVKPENVGDYVRDVKLNLAKDFGISKLSTEEVKALIELNMAGHLPREELLKILSMGGWLISDVDNIISQLEEGV